MVEVVTSHCSRSKILPPSPVKAWSPSSSPGSDLMSSLSPGHNVCFMGLEITNTFNRIRLNSKVLVQSFALGTQNCVSESRLESQMGSSCSIICYNLWQALALPESQFAHLRDGSNATIRAIGLVGESKDIMPGTQLAPDKKELLLSGHPVTSPLSMRQA